MQLIKLTYEAPGNTPVYVNIESIRRIEASSTDGTAIRFIADSGDEVYITVQEKLQDVIARLGKIL